MRQTVRLTGRAAPLAVRRPHWADGVTALGADGKPVALTTDGDWLVTTKPTGAVTFVYRGGLFGEDRHCAKLAGEPAAGQAFVLCFGPKLLAVNADAEPKVAWPTTLAELTTAGWRPLPATSDKPVRMVAVRK